MADVPVRGAQVNIFAAYEPADPVMRVCWYGCLRWSLGRPDVMEEFRAETGLTWTPGRTPLDRMIDTAVGADVEFFQAYAAWMNTNIWGDDDSEVPL